MEKRFAFSLFVLLNCLLFLQVSFSSDQIETMSVENQINLEPIANNNLLDNDITLKEPNLLNTHYALWIKNIKKFAENNPNLSDFDMNTAFMDSFDPKLYRAPIIVPGYENLKFYFLHGMTPKKDSTNKLGYTPDRLTNFNRLNQGKPGILKNEDNQIIRKAAHHVEQHPTTGCIVLVTRDFHKANHDLLHPIKKNSRIDRNEFARIKRAAYQLLLQNIVKEHEIDDEQLNQLKKIGEIAGLNRKNNKPSLKTNKKKETNSKTKKNNRIEVNKENVNPNKRNRDIVQDSAGIKKRKTDNYMISPSKLKMSA